MAKYATTVRCAEAGYTEASLKARATKYQMSARAPTSSRAQSHSPTRPTSCQQVLPQLPTNTTALRTTTTPRMPTLRSRTTTVVQPQAPTQAQAPLPRKLPPGSHGIPPHPVYHHRPPPTTPRTSTRTTHARLPQGRALGTCPRTTTSAEMSTMKTMATTVRARHHRPPLQRQGRRTRQAIQSNRKSSLAGHSFNPRQPGYCNHRTHGKDRR